MDDRQTAADSGGSSRRGFLLGAASAAVGAGMLGVAGAATGAAASGQAGAGQVGVAGSQRAPHRHYARGVFEAAPGARMRITVGGEQIALTIEDIQPLGVSAAAAAGSRLWHNAFRVRMKGPRGTHIPQGTYPVSVGGRAFDLFVVPVLSTGAHQQFEAIINRAFHRRAHG